MEIKDISDTTVNIVTVVERMVSDKDWYYERDG